ncbi:hypothetical protein FFJ24_010395 [Pedobacter sp. KBS0701]|uniref:hypothetical protein n=1 Tax=Pedobacter sp. KBS0701 TaxID=2578106 RepID=UPI00110E6D49|nr:hypothetical protein [Pedobacter sp. KBS0701]QDW25197.1 hypothetical protein FFJ24_010395 [Pedobacter sp. KBS0701]
MLYLQQEQLKSNLSLGKAVEQWINAEIKEDYVIIKWLRIEKEADGSYTVTYFECFDEGDENFVDVYEFSMLDPDYPFGIITSFSSIKDAIDFSVENYGASVLKFVSGGMIQEEYANYSKNKP